MDRSSYEGFLNNIIAYYGLLVAVLLPVTIFLIGEIKNSPGIDKQVLFKKIFPVRYMGILLGAILPVVQFLVFDSDMLGNAVVRLVVVIMTVFATCLIFHSITKMVTWVSSGENKEAFHGFYRQNIRLEFLGEGNIKERSEKWYRFWSDEKTVKYFGNDICRYIDCYFDFLHSLKGNEEWEYAKKSGAVFFYNIDELYKIGKRGVRTSAYDCKSLACELMETIPFCVCDNLIRNIDDLREKNGGMSLWCGVFLSNLLNEMIKDNSLNDSDWVATFNLYFFGNKKEKKKALAAIVMIMAACKQFGKTKRSIKEGVYKLKSASGDKYASFYTQLYKEMFSFDEHKSKLLKMTMDGAKM